MSKKPETKTESKTDEVVVNQPANAPVVPSNPAAPVSRETLSHQWQENSPALNTNVLAYHTDQGENVVLVNSDEYKDAKEEADKLRFEEAEELEGYDYDARTKLDVSNPLYINPSLGHFKKKK